MSLVEHLRGLNGVASVRTLNSHGFGTGLLRGAVRAELVYTVRKGWIALPDAAPNLVRAVALGGRLGCISAAAHRGLWVHSDSVDLHVAIPRHSGRSTAHNTPGVIGHWQSDKWGALGSAIELPPAMALQLATCLPSEQAIATLDSALNRKLLSLADIAVALGEARDDVSDVLPALDASSESGLESLCRVRLARLGLTVKSQVSITGVGRVDLIVGDRLVIEADGKQWHNSPDAFEIDRQRDLHLGLLGYRVIRLTWAQIIHEWPLVELSIRAMVSRGEHLWSTSVR